jgi:hypothetical protein
LSGSGFGMYCFFTVSIRFVSSCNFLRRNDVASEASCCLPSKNFLLYFEMTSKKAVGVTNLLRPPPFRNDSGFVIRVSYTYLKKSENDVENSFSLVANLLTVLSSFKNSEYFT